MDNCRLLCDGEQQFVICNCSGYLAAGLIIPLGLLKVAKCKVKASTLLPSQHDGHGTSNNSPGESPQRVRRDGERPEQQDHVVLQGNARALLPGFVHEHLDVLREKDSAV